MTILSHRIVFALYVGLRVSGFVILALITSLLFDSTFRQLRTQLQYIMNILTKSLFIWLDSVFHFASNGGCFLIIIIIR